MSDVDPRRLTVVVAEDEATIRMATVYYLTTKCDCRVLEASNGEELLAIVKREQVDIIFTDHEMQGTYGLDAIRVIRSDPRFRSVRVILTSAYELQEEARKIGVRFLPKPYRLEELREALGLS